MSPATFENHPTGRTAGIAWLYEAALSAAATFIAAASVLVVARFWAAEINGVIALALALVCWVGGMVGVLASAIAPGLSPALRYLVGMIFRMGLPLMAVAMVAVFDGRPAVGTVVVLLVSYLACQAVEAAFCLRYAGASAPAKPSAA